MKVDLEQANEKECEVLKKIWGSAQGMDSMLKYLQKKIDEFWWDAHWHWNCISWTSGQTKYAHFKKTYINSALAHLGNRSGLPPPLLLSRGLKVLYHLNLNKTPFSLIVTYRYIYTHTSVCVCIYMSLYI